MENSPHDQAHPPPPPSNLSSTLDVYARPFVPQRLRQVNLDPANVIWSAPPQSINYHDYVRTFAGSSFIHHQSPSLFGHDAPEANLDTNYASPNPQNESTGARDLFPQSLGSRSYHQHFHAALLYEGQSLQKECDDHALYRVPIVWDSHDSRPFMFLLHVPGLRESSIRIEVGDVVQLRQLRFDHNWEVINCPQLQGRPIPDPRYFDTQHNSIVWGIDRREETLRLRIDGLIFGSMLFNVRFMPQSTRLRAQFTAVTKVSDALYPDTFSNWMRSMLFPEAADGYYQKSLNRRSVDLEFPDPLLNYEQSKAIDTVLGGRYGPVPFIVSGPPGTGKTKTVVEMALQLLQRDNGAHILLCAPSDPAADTLVRRLSMHMNPPQLLRVNASSRSFPEVSNTILPYCHIEDGIFSLPSFAQLMKAKAVVITCRDANMLLQALLCTPKEAPYKPRLHWSGLLVDEAAQAIEPEALLPLSVVAPPSSDAVREEDWPLFVMAGDQHQLGPRTALKAPEIQTSLFERLLDRPFYCQHPLARSKGSGGSVRPLTQDMLPILRPAFTDLIRNYRSHPAILAMPSSLFYHDTLEPEATNTDSLLSWPRWQCRGWPVLFVSNTAADELEQDGGGWYNVKEAFIACEYASSFVQAGLLQPSEVCIMSPFQAQVKVLRKVARADFSLPGLNIGPLEAFQGLESRLVIICTTRTRDRFIDQDVARGLGILHEPKRFNVALTRAKEGLIVIGNASVLVRDRNWSAWLRFCRRNGLCEDKAVLDGIVPGGDEDDGWKERSRLEKQLVSSEQAQGGLLDIVDGARELGIAHPDDYLWDSGLEAEELVRGKWDHDPWPTDSAG
ncbi:uncharacterized protein LTR77_006676 [Saxophila tyrrhenica]|uniref:RNA helicase n=1 Tax=Saxophila tyrrhenica TaxID=1690608 RepID=A0AAV9P5Z9_9PEZI|nr:hypothetical protein LTR77_006676 [Saxophila tyrrhenica]